MRKRKSRYDQPLLHTVEEATELLRRVKIQAWVWWFGGTLPFVVTLLHFWSDMSRSSVVVAADRLPSAALLVALTYWWMKIAQSMFGDHLLRHLRDEATPPAMPLRGKLRFITSQALIHFTTPWLLVLSLAAMLPFAWVYAFYHNALILAPGHFRNGGKTRDLVRIALQQSHYRPAHNHSLLILLFLASMLVWINGFLGAITVATLLQSFTGDANAITRNPFIMFSSSIIATSIAVAYVIAGPLVKSVYALRCFHGLSRKNGEDLLVAFRRAAAPVMLALLCIPMPAHAANSNAREPASAPRVETPSKLSPTTPSVDPTALDQHIREVLQREAFQWRLPRDMTKPAAQHGWLSDFYKAVGDWIKGAGKWVGNLFDQKLKDWIKGLLNSKDAKHHDGFDASTPWADMAHMVLVVLLVLLGVAIIALIVRQWMKQPPKVAVPVVVPPEVDLESDHVVASALPENEWLRLAQEKIDAGDYRLAMRALFLAILAHLGDRRMLRIVRSKSNGDYVRELALRARDRSDLRGHFTDTVRVFDWAWYGWHDVTRDVLDQFRAHHQHITSDGAK